MTNIKDILKSKLSNKDNLPEWYNRRMEICNTCEWNSKNKPRKEWTIQDKKWNALNLGEPFCTACGCEISAKDSLPHAVCGLKSIGLKPKWGAVETISKTGQLEIENISTTPLKVNEIKGEIWLDYGTIPIGQETDVQILIKDLENKMTDISAGAGCGCTIPKLKKEGNEITLKINYDTKRVGKFTKTVVLSYKKNNMDFEKIFKITGKTE